MTKDAIEKLINSLDPRGGAVVVSVGALRFALERFVSFQTEGFNRENVRRIVDLAVAWGAESPQFQDPEFADRLIDCALAEPDLEKVFPSFGLHRKPVDNIDWQDRAEGLQADLDNAIEVIWKRGGTEYVRLNYPKHFERLAARTGAEYVQSGYMAPPAQPTVIHSPHSAGVFPKGGA